MLSHSGAGTEKVLTVPEWMAIGDGVTVCKGSDSKTMATFDIVMSGGKTIFGSYQSNAASANSNELKLNFDMTTANTALNFVTLSKLFKKNLETTMSYTVSQVLNDKTVTDQAQVT